MSALAEVPVAKSKPQRNHIYHASASLLDAEVQFPLEEKIYPQANVQLYGSGDKSYHHFREITDYRFEGIFSYRYGYTQVAGHKSPKPGHGYATLATSVVEGLNILDVLTADRVVARISTDHPVDGEVPSVSFLGTRFENLRIGGHKVEIGTDLEMVGPKPKEDKSYFDENYSGMLGRFSKQQNDVRGSGSVPEWLELRRNGEPKINRDEASCSLATGLDKKHLESLKSLGLQVFGNAIYVPHFGKLYFGELTVSRDKPTEPNEYESYHFRLTMVRFKLGCPTVTSGGASTADSNGQGGHN
jgi:hypothetical protein